MENSRALPQGLTENGIDTPEKIKARGNKLGKPFHRGSEVSAKKYIEKNFYKQDEVNMAMDAAYLAKKVEDGTPQPFACSEGLLIACMIELDYCYQEHNGQAYFNVTLVAPAPAPAPATV